jgi:photosystem II stability/assembly factor-like uncharacterized protein
LRFRLSFIGLAIGLLAVSVGVTVLVLIRGGDGSAEASSTSVYGELVSPALGYVVSSSGAGPHLYLVDPEGHDWREVSPPLVAEQGLYDVFFLNRRMGWVSAGSCSTSKWVAYRTRNGGRTWHPMEPTSVGCAAGSGIEYVFLDRDRGWRSEYLGNAPNGNIERTEDGGRTWLHVASDEGGGSGYGVSGHITLQSALRAWVRHQNDEGSLKASRDGGKTWRPIRLKRRPPPDVRPTYPLEHYQLPTFFGRKAILPVTHYWKRTVLVVYPSDDAGEHWRLAAKRTFPRRCSPTIDAVTMRTWWLVLDCQGRSRLGITVDGGRSWRGINLPVSPSPRRLRVSAVNVRRAWLSAVRDVQPLDLYSTGDGGRTWQRIEPPDE